MLLAGGHAFFQRGLEDILEWAGFAVVARAADLGEALELLAEYEPDIALVDIDLPGGLPLESLEALAERAPAVRLLALTLSADGEDVAAAVAAGADGYLLKRASPFELAAEIRAAAAGNALVLPATASRLLEQAGAGRHDERAAGLSERELEVLRLIVDGRDNGEIAASLFISPSTAKCHVSHILGKLGTKNRIQAAVYAVRCGLA